MGQSIGLGLAAVGAVAAGVLSGGSLLAVEAGFMAGSVLGSLLFPAKKPNPADVRVQDSAYGKWIPSVWGRYRMSGNVIWMGTPHSHATGGKGMSSKSQQPYTTLSFAVALCTGPIDAVNRIWANGKLIYDVSNPSDWKSISGSSSMVTGFTVYTGSETQGPDPLMQSYLGAANTPAYRGLAYVVFNELNLQTWGNYMPSLTFEVVRGSTATTVIAAQQNVALSSNPAIGAVPIAVTTLIDSSGTSYGCAQGITGSSYSSQFYKMTPYGTQWLNSVVNNGTAALVNSQSVSGGTAGAYFSDGYWRDVNGGVFNTGIPMGLGPSSNASAAYYNGQVYVTTNYGGGAFPIWTSVPVAVGVPVVFQSPSNWVFTRLLCATATGVYAQINSSSPNNPNSVCKFDTQGNFVAQLFTIPTGTYGSAYAVSDTEIYFNLAGNVQLWNGTSLTNTAIPATNGANQSTCYVTPDARSIWTANYATSYNFQATVAGDIPSGIPLSTIVAEICADAGLTSDQYDVSQLTDTVIGYATGTSNSSPRDMITPLQTAYFFDISDSDTVLKFIRRGALPTVTIPWDDLGADADSTSSQSQNPISEVIKQEYELPAQEALSYTSAYTDYQTSTQREFMPATTSNLIESASVPIVMGDNDAKERVQAILWERWAQRRSYSWTTDYKWLELEAGDVINLQRQDLSVLPVRITKTTLDGKGKISYEGDFCVPSLYPNPGLGSPANGYVASGGSSSGFVPQSVPYAGPTLLQVLDLPPLRAQDASSPGLYVAAAGMTSDWPGIILELSRDDNTFAQVMSMVSASVIGYTTTALPAFNGGNIVDELNTVTVYLYNASQSLSSITNTQLLNGSNAALIGKELVYFRTATQLTANTWQLSGFLRSRLGTEAASLVHATGDNFVLLDSTKIAPLSINLSDIGQPLYFDAYLDSLNNSLSATQAITPTNGRLSPFAPHSLQNGRGAPNSSGLATDLTLQWIRKARVNNAWYESVDVPLDWSQESYKIVISTTGGAVINTYTLAAAGVTWTGGFTPAGAAIAAQPVPQSYTSSSGVVSNAQAYPQFTAPNTPKFVYSLKARTQDGLSAGTTYNATVSQVGDYGIAGATATTSFVAF